MTPTDLSTRRWPLLASACFSFFAVGCTFFAVPPLVPELIARFGLDQFRVGLLMGAISVPAIFLSIPIGAAIDRWAARAAGNWGLVMMVIGGALFALAPNYALLLAGRFLFGIGGLIMNLLLARLITTAFAGRELALAMGIFSAVYPASMIFMFSFHSPLDKILGWRGELTALAALALIAMPFHTMVVPRGQRGAAQDPAESRRPNVNRPLVALAVSWMFFFVAFAPVITFAPQWVGKGSCEKKFRFPAPRLGSELDCNQSRNHKHSSSYSEDFAIDCEPKPARRWDAKRGSYSCTDPEDQQGLLTVTLIMWTALVLSPIVGILIDRLGRPAVWGVSGAVLLATTLVLMAFSAVPPAAAMLAIGVCAALVPTATYALPGTLVPVSQVGFAFGLITAFSNLGTVVGPTAVGAIRDHGHGWPGAWAVVAVAALAGAVAMAVVGTSRKSA